MLPTQDPNRQGVTTGTSLPTLQIILPNQFVPRLSTSVSHCYGSQAVNLQVSEDGCDSGKNKRASNYNSSNKHNMHSRYEPKVKFQNYNIHIHYSADITS